MRRLQLWGFILLIANGNDLVESFPSTARETRQHGRGQQCNSVASGMVHNKVESIIALTGRNSRKDSLLFLSSIGESPTSVSGLEEGSVLESEMQKDGGQMSEYDPTEEDNNDEEDMANMNDNVVAMRLTQRGFNFERSERWLEDATEKIFDPSVLPLGSLADDDIVAITGLMIAWSRRNSLEGALKVENLLKRVVDDMRAGNEDAYVSTKMYIVAMEAWGKSDEEAGAQRAQSIHDAMIQTYKETKDPMIRPTTKSYNTLIRAWAKSKNPSALVAGEKTFKDLTTAEKALKNVLIASNQTISDTSGTIRQDSATYAAMLDLYARNNNEESIVKAERLVKSMPRRGVKKTRNVYSALQDVYLGSGRDDAPKKIFSVLRKMIRSYSQGNAMARPNLTNFNRILSAYSRTPSKVSAERAVTMLNRMEKAEEDGGYEVDPDRQSYFLAILACSQCPDRTLGANLAEPLLERMEKIAKDEAEKREELSIAAPPLVSLDRECFNVVLMALSRSRDSNAIDRIFQILSRMEDYANQGQEHLRPTTRSMNTALHALGYTKSNTAAKKAEQTLDRMFQMHADGIPDIKPDSYSHVSILRMYKRLGTPEAAERASEILLRMEQLHEKGVLDSPPDHYHYTMVCATWSLSKTEIAPQKCLEILTRMKEKEKEGRKNAGPNVVTYNAVLGEFSDSIVDRILATVFCFMSNLGLLFTDCFSRSHLADRAEQFLYYMLSQAKNGDSNARPNAFSFHAVINAFIYSKIRDAGRRAESVLERGLEYAEEDDGEMLGMQSFTSILGFYGRQTKVLDSPYRAQYLLNRLISLYKAGNAHLSPHVSCFTNVMEAYAAQRHRDAGECSEELLNNMAKLQKFHNATNLEVNLGVMNCILNGWAECDGHPDAGNRAERILELMEEKSTTGATNMAPTYRSYTLVLKAWLKSKSPEKAQRALVILERMKKNRHLQLSPGYAHSLVIQTCAFSEYFRPKTQKRAFEIAVQVMNEFIDVPANQSEPSFMTTSCGWFFQVCAKLELSEISTESHIRRTFSLCCENGLFTEFVLNSLKQATSDALFAELIAESVSVQDTAADLKDTVLLSHLPKSWIASAPDNFEPRQKSKENWQTARKTRTSK